jgi:hypothetical protein
MGMYYKTLKGFKRFVVVGLWNVANAFRQKHAEYMNKVRELGNSGKDSHEISKTRKEIENCQRMETKAVEMIRLYSNSNGIPDLDGLLKNKDCAA